MSSLWTDLLFLHGHIHDPELARRLANTSSMPPPDLQGGERQRTHSPIAALASLCAVCAPETATTTAAATDEGEHDHRACKHSAAAR